MNWKVGKGGQT